MNGMRCRKVRSSEAFYRILTEAILLAKPHLLKTTLIFLRTYSDKTNAELELNGNFKNWFSQISFDQY